MPGHFQYRITQVGLVNAPASFQFCINKTLHSFWDVFATFIEPIFGSAKE